MRRLKGQKKEGASGGGGIGTVIVIGIGIGTGTGIGIGIGIAKAQDSFSRQQVNTVTTVPVSLNWSLFDHNERKCDH